MTRRAGGAMTSAGEGGGGPPVRGFGNILARIECNGINYFSYFPLLEPGGRGRALAGAAYRGAVDGRAGARHLRRKDLAINCRPFGRTSPVKTDKTWIF